MHSLPKYKDFKSIPNHDSPFASDSYVGVEEMPSPVHAIISQYVMEEIIEIVRSYLPLEADGSMRKHDLELRGDGCKNLIVSVSNS
jgi:hypothetical protein